MKNIVIPTDFSDNAWDAIRYAIKLYDDISARFYILNTFKENTSISRISNEGNTSNYKLQEEESIKGLTKIQNHLDNYLLNDNHEYKTVSRKGHLLSTLKHMVSTKNIDIIVMGTTGAKGAHEMFIGSNAVKVIKGIDLCPVLIVPKNYILNELKNITLAIDLKKNFGVFELNSLMDLQAIHQSKITILHITETNQLNKNEIQHLNTIKSLFKNDSVSVMKKKIDGKIANTIIDFSKKHKMDLICLVNSEKKFIQNLLEEPIVKKVNFLSEIPILTLPI